MEHAKDLQIGDWVQGFVPDSHCRVCAIFNCNRIAIITTDNFYIELPIDEICPVSLTAEILKKNGFEKSGPCLFIFGDDCLEVLIRECTDGIWQVEYTFREMYFPLCRNLVCNVHELQHALRLCGIEKNIML